MGRFIMTIKRRILKLESTIKDEPKPFHIMRIVIDSDNRQQVGYRCQDTEVYKMDDESSTQFRARLHESVEWDIGKTSRMIFEPIYSDLCQK